MGIEEAENYLEQIANEDAELYAAIKKYFLSFDDLLEMPEHIMKVFWRNPDIDAEDLAKACKGYEESVINNIITYLPKRKQKMFEPYEQPLSKKEAEKAQLAIVSIAKKMGDEGEINLEELMEDTDDMIE
jgi:flagellar motor switch protein FliG